MSHDKNEIIKSINAQKTINFLDRFGYQLSPDKLKMMNTYDHAMIDSNGVASNFNFIVKSKHRDKEKASSKQKSVNCINMELIKLNG